MLQECKESKRIIHIILTKKAFWDIITQLASIKNNQNDNMGDIMERENNLLKKNIVKQSYKIVSLFIMFLSASALWYYNISPYW